ncbi:MAG: hypothetical protein AABM32_08910 [Chloroflexota bacterium]
MTTAAVAAYALLSAAIVAFHLSAWLAAGSGDHGLGDPAGFFARSGWGLTTYLLGQAWMALLVFASWRVVRSARPRPLSAVTILAIVVFTPLILSAIVNVPYKGASATEFLDVFLQPGGITPGGNGTLQHILMSAAAGGIAAVHVAHALARPQSVRSQV